MTSNIEDDFEIVDSDNSLYNDIGEETIDAGAGAKDFSLVTTTKHEYDEEVEDDEEEEVDEEQQRVRKRAQPLAKRVPKPAVMKAKKKKKKSKKSQSQSQSQSQQSPSLMQSPPPLPQERQASTTEAECHQLLQETTETNLALKLRLREFESELLLVKRMKSKMQKQCSKYENLVSENSALNHQMKDELQAISDQHLQLKQERKEVELLRQQLSEDRNSLSEILSCIDGNGNSNSNGSSNGNHNSKSKSASKSGNKSNANANANLNVFSENRELLGKLRNYFSECSNMKQESEQIHAMCSEQRQLINDCKSRLQGMRDTHQEKCLISLDKSKSFACKECGVDMALQGDIESKCYQVGQGAFTEKKRGYLFKTGVNLVCGPQKTENFTTGAYQISWVSCVKCQTKMGWKYISADNNTNTSKVGKFCLARYSLTSPEERLQK